MNLIEALKSKKPLRQKNGGLWIYPLTSNIIFNIKQILADDWEIQEEKIEITKSQLIEALRKDYPSNFILPSTYEEIARKLGFKE